MKIQSKQLSAALSDVLGCVPPRSTLPVLSCVYLKGQPGSLTLKTSNLDQTAERQVPCEEGTPFELCVPAKILASYLAKARCETTDLTVDLSGDLRVECGSSGITLRTLPADEFPADPNQEEMPASFKADFASVIEPSLKWASLAMSDDDTRYVLNGVHYEIGKETVFVATCGRRLHMATLEGESQGEAIGTIPTPAVRAILALNAHGEVIIRAGKTTAEIEWDDGLGRMTTKLIEGNYPNYMQVIPDDQAFSDSVDYEPGEFVSAIDQVLISRKETPVNIVAEKGSLKLSVADIDIGEARSELPAKEGCETNLEQFRVNAMFLKQSASMTHMLRVADGTVIEMQTEGGARKAIVMGMRIDA